MHPQPLSQLAAHSKDRVQRRHRLLKDHPNLVSPNRAHQALVRFGEINLITVAPFKEQTPPRYIAATVLNQPHQRE